MIYWDFGDGTSATGTLTPTHTYGDNGYYTITLTVTDTFGTVGSDSLQVSTPNVAPSLTNIPDQTVMINHQLTFPVLFTDPGWLDSHTVAIEWAPGFTETINLDAGVTEYSSQHTYIQDGQFVVTVTVTDHDGASDSHTFIIDVEAYRVFFPQIQR